MMRALLLLAVVACNIPTEADVREATGTAVDQCRDVVADAIPQIVGQITLAAVGICGDISGDIAHTRAAVAYEVLVALGCSWDGSAWDCSTAPLLCGDAP